jgi:hypothetical protein
VSHITLDAAVANQLTQLTESVEVRDPSGRVLGRFIPLIDMTDLPQMKASWGLGCDSRG